VSVPRPFDYRYLRPPDRLETYHATLIQETSEHIILQHTVNPQTPVLAGGKEILRDGSPIVWFLFKNRSYDVGRFYLPDGTWTGYYSDITEPICWEGADAGSLETVVDLFLDVWISPEGSHEVLDADELEDALTSGWITQDQARRAKQTVEEVLVAIDSDSFPPRPALDWPGPLATPENLQSTGVTN
jgi:predicted RNA-binding protein associated with RNAse of E/G family